jgi:hypothetical protein
MKDWNKKKREIPTTLQERHMIFLNKSPMNPDSR